MVESVLSKNDVPIRLTPERWAHIVEEHCELAGLRLEILETISDPSRILEGSIGELIAVRKFSNKYLVVIYRELENDGFVITAFITSKEKAFNKRRQIWPK